MRRLLIAFIAALLGALVGATPACGATSVDAVEPIGSICNAAHSSLSKAHARTERGPPVINHADTTTPNAVDCGSHGALVRPATLAAPVLYTYDDPTLFARVAGVAPTTLELGEAAAPGERWQRAVRVTLQAMVDRGARVAWLGAEGVPFCDPPELFSPECMSGGVLGWITDSGEYSCELDPDRPIARAADDTLLKLRLHARGLADAT